MKPVLGGDVEFFIYADDVKLVKALHDVSDCSALQRALDHLYAFTLKIGLQLSPRKYGVLRIGSELPASTCTIGTSHLCRFEVAKDLGVMFSTSLSFTEHVNTTIKKCVRICSWILRVFSLSDPLIYVDLYKTLLSCPTSNTVV